MHKAAQIFIAFTLVVGGIGHLLPVAGVVSAQRLSSMYGVAVHGADMTLLLRHRAVLFLIVGGLALLGAWREELRRLALVVLVLSAGSFVLLAVIEGPVNARLVRVVRADLLMVLLGVPALVAHWLLRSGRS